MRFRGVRKNPPFPRVGTAAPILNDACVLGRAGVVKDGASLYSYYTTVKSNIITSFGMKALSQVTKFCVLHSSKRKNTGDINHCLRRLYSSLIRMDCTDSWSIRYSSFGLNDDVTHHIPLRCGLSTSTTLGPAPENSFAMTRSPRLSVSCSLSNLIHWPEHMGYHRPVEKVLFLGP